MSTTGMVRIWKMSDRKNVWDKTKCLEFVQHLSDCIRCCLKRLCTCVYLCTLLYYRILCFLQMEALKSSVSPGGTAICFQFSSFEKHILTPMNNWHAVLFAVHWRPCNRFIEGKQMRIKLFFTLRLMRFYSLKLDQERKWSFTSSDKSLHAIGRDLLLSFSAN